MPRVRALSSTSRQMKRCIQLLASSSCCLRPRTAVLILVPASRNAVPKFDSAAEDIAAGEFFMIVGSENGSGQPRCTDLAEVVAHHVATGHVATNCTSS